MMKTSEGLYKHILFKEPLNLVIMSKNPTTVLSQHTPQVSILKYLPVLVLSLLYPTPPFCAGGYVHA